MDQREHRKSGLAWAGVFAVVAALPMVLGSYWGVLRLGNWLCERFFTEETPQEIRVTSTGVYVSNALLILLTAFWMRVAFSFFRDFIGARDEPGETAEEIEEYGIRNFLSSMTPIDPKNSVAYVFKRAGVIVYYVLFCMGYAFFSGRLVAALMGKPFLPSGKDGMGVAIMLVPYLFMLLKSAWWFANKEVEHSRLGYPVTYDQAVLIHYLLPYGVIFLVAGVFTEGQGSAQQTGGITLFLLLLLYLGWRKLIDPATKWRDEQRLRDRAFGAPPSSGGASTSGPGPSSLEEQPDRRE